MKKTQIINIMSFDRRLKKLEAALEKKTIELEAAKILMSKHDAIVKYSEDAIVSKNLNGIINSWNKGAERIFGYKSSEAIGKHISLIIPPYLLKEEEYIISKIRKGERIEHFETTRVNKNGTLVNISVSISPIKNSKGEIVGAAKIARDITAQKKMTQQKEDFVGLVSHELKTPITSMKMYAHITNVHLQKNDVVKGIEYVKRIDEQVDRLSKLVIDLLDVTRVTKGKIEYHKTEFYIDDFVKDVIKDLKSISTNHPIKCKKMLHRKVFADKDRMRQVLINLITNAVKYSPMGGTITIGQIKKDSSIITSVQDQGIGIAKEEQKKIFNRFYQVNSPDLKTYPGLGLGLYICREIVTHNGGNLDVKSTKGKGSTFFFDLPTKKV